MKTKTPKTYHPNANLWNRSEKGRKWRNKFRNTQKGLKLEREAWMMSWKRRKVV